MKKILLLISIFFCLIIQAQGLRLVKGAINDNLIVNDTVTETFSLFLPSSFDMAKQWPVLFVFDLENQGTGAISMLKNSAEKEGYILASSNGVSDSLSISLNVRIANRMFNAVYNLVPIDKNRSYTAGFGNGGRFASVLPIFVSSIKGVLSIGAPVANAEVISSKRPFQFIGIVNRQDFNFREMLVLRRVLDSKKFPNNLLVFDGDQKLPDIETISLAMKIFTLSSMAKGETEKNNVFIKEAYTALMGNANALLTAEKPILAKYLLSDINRIFNPFVNLDSVKQSEKTLRKSSSYKKANRSQNSYFLKEDFTKDDIGYYLEEDVLSNNYANLGWWKYQMEELDKLDKSSILFEKQMSARLRGYINALILDEIDYVSSEAVVNRDAQDFLYMLKTITSPKEYSYYLKIISNSASIEDYGTALFYLEELLKNGYTNKKELYVLPNTALLRITPEFNEVVEKYLNVARYDLIEE